MRTRILTLIAVLCLPTAAFAGFGFQHNLYVAGNMQSQNSDVEGTLAVGGNLQVQNYGVGSALPSSGGSDTLVVGQNLTFTNGQVKGGNARYGLTASVSGMGTPNGTLAQGSPLDFGSLTNYYSNSSQQLAQLGTTAGASFNNNYGSLTLTAADSGLNVFNLTTADLSGLNGLTIDAASDATVLINVDGAAVTLANMGVSLSGGVTASQVLYNFYSASSITLSGIGFQGSMLATGAHLDFSNGQFNGQAAVGSFIGTGEWHNISFSGQTERVVVVPAPGASLLALLGLGLVGVCRRT